MKPEEAGSILQRMYNEAPDNVKTAYIVLFGIVYGDRFDQEDISDIVTYAGIRGESNQSYNTEVRRGQQLSSIVKLTGEGKRALSFLDD